MYTILKIKYTAKVFIGELLIAWSIIDPSVTEGSEKSITY
jgi:hypothetical protein